MTESEASKATSASERQTNAVDVATILKGFNVLKSENSEEIPFDKSAADAFLAVVQDAANASACVGQLFPNGIPLDQSFFDRLDEFHRWIGIATSGDEAIGIVWSEAMRRLASAGQQQLLHVFATQKGHDFFENLGSLHVVVKDHSFPAGFLANWFADLLQAVERDMMQDGVWATIRTLCTCHPDVALEVLWALSTPPDSRRLNIAGFMLGALRSLSVSKQYMDELGRVEGFFRAHADNAYRAVFNWSWVTTARDSGITPEQLESLFDRAAHSQEDLSNVVCVVCRISAVARLSVELAQRCHDWLNTHISSSLSPDAKFYVVSAAEQFARENDESRGPRADVSKWIVSIQPVPEDKQGIWGRTADYLCDILNRAPQQFCDVFQRLCRTSAATIHHLMSNRSLEHLAHDMHKAGVGELAGRLAVSVDRATRELGLYLF